MTDISQAALACSLDVLEGLATEGAFSTSRIIHEHMQSLLAKPSRFVIRDGVKIPSKQWAQSRYPFHKLKVGQCFTASDDSKARSAASMFSKRHPKFRFTTRKVDGGVEIWRTK